MIQTKHILHLLQRLNQHPLHTMIRQHWIIHKINLTTPHHHHLRTHERIIIPMNLQRIRKHVLKLTKVNLILHKHSVRLHQQCQRLNDIQTVLIPRHLEAHHRLAQIHNDHVKAPKVIIRQHHERLRSVPKPPFHLRIIKMGLLSKMLETGSGHPLVQFEPHRQFEVGIFEEFMEEHTVPPAHPQEPLHVLLHVPRSIVHR